MPSKHDETKTKPACYEPCAIFTSIEGSLSLIEGPCRTRLRIPNSGQFQGECDPLSRSLPLPRSPLSFSPSLPRAQIRRMTPPNRARRTSVFVNARVNPRASSISTGGRNNTSSTSTRARNHASVSDVRVSSFRHSSTSTMVPMAPIT